MSLCRSVDRSGSSVEFSRHVVVSISLNLSSFINPPLVLDVTNLSLDIGTQYMVFSFPDVTMTMVLPVCEGMTLAFYQSFDLFVIFIEPVLVTLGFEPECFFAGIHQSSFDMGPVFFYRKIIVWFREQPFL